MADTKTEKQKVQEITEKLEQGIKELFESEKYKNYLNTMSKFHNYSFNNTLLIAMQKPDATLVAGFQAWKKNFERHVKKGEKGIRILAPAPYKVKEEQEKLDPETNEIMLDKEGKPIMEEVEVTIPAFRAVSVFDVSQTDGRELPELTGNELSADVEGYQDFMKALEMVSPVPIGYEDISGEAKGYYHTEEQRVAIQQGMSESQTVKTAIHEVAHAKLHSRELNKDTDLSEPKNRNTKEVEAESVAYTVCQHFGIDTSDYSFGYIAGWSSGKEMTELKSSLDTIRRTASEMISGIEVHLQELQKDRVAEQEQDIVQIPEEAELPIMKQEEMKNELEESSANREVQFLYGKDNQFGIYQLKDTAEARDIRFMNMDYLESKGIDVVRENYDLVYIAPLEDGTNLENIYTKFNIDHPADFKGHSLSVSDVVVLHQSGENTSHYVDSFGYREVPEFIQEMAQELQAENVSVMDEATEMFDEIPQESTEDEKDRENAVFLVNYNEWREVSELDFEQNYFAIDDPYGDEDFRLLQLQNGIIDITPAGVHYDNYEEAAQALLQVERDVANLPFNKENNIGSYMVNGRSQLENIMEARNLQKHLDIENDKVSYYVIADLSTWAENSPQKSKLERFESFTDALEQFKAYRKKDAQFSDDKARTTFGVNVHGIEFDVIHARNNENVLSLDFTHSSEAKQSDRFMDDLQILCNELVDKVRLHRDMTPEEVKDFVKERFEYQLNKGGFDDISMYMSRFDTLYEQGKMEHLMPTANQKHIMEDIPLVEWDNEYISINNRFADIADKELSVVEYETLLGLEPAQVSVDGLMEIMNSNAKLWNYPVEEKDHCLQENIPVVTVCDGEETRYFEIPEELVAKVRESEFWGFEPEQMAFSITDKFVSIQTCDDGYDYSIFDANYRLLDGGVYDNPDISIHAALKDILEDIGVTERDERIPVDYEELIEKGEAVEQAEIAARHIVSDFKEKTNEMFHNIEGQTPEDVEQTAYAYIKSKIEEYEIDVDIVDVAVSGSRCRGLEKEDSDLDIVVEYKGKEKEDDLFNAFNEDGLKIGGVKVDINPITEGKTGTLATYLPGVESYLAEKREAMQKESVKEDVAEKKPTIVTLMVSECSEFHNLGEFHEGIETVDEAIKLYNQIPPERMNGIRGIGINVHTEGTERYEDVEMDIVSGKVADLEILDYVPDITDEPKAIEMIAELIVKLPNIEVHGSLEKWQAASLATQIDQLSYDYDTYQYKDTVEDRDAQVANIAEDIRNGNTEYLNDFLNAIVAESVREGITDIFGQATEIDDSEAVQTARRAKELLDKLSEYKPLAKVEELEESNYNMIDNVLNNEKSKKEEERSPGRISIKEKLAEKKAMIEHRDKGEKLSPDKDAEKKSHREI